MLICPICRKKLLKDNNRYCCENNHSFDISKDGYINLLKAKSSVSGDNKEMILSRCEIHCEGLYEPLASKVKDIITSIISNNSSILDSGCGEGYYLNYLKKAFDFSGIGIDISKYAVQKASKRNKDMLFIVSSSNDIPLENNSINLILSIFSPWFDQEFSRVLKDNGYLLVVSPGEKHLLELKELLYQNSYLNEEKHYNLTSFKLLSSFTLTYQKTVNNIISLIKMTPYYYKTSKESINKISTLTSLLVTFDFKILLYKKL